MIKEGQFTIIDGKTYQVVRIDDNFAHLQNVESIIRASSQDDSVAGSIF